MPAYDYYDLAIDQVMICLKNRSMATDDFEKKTEY